MKTKVCEICMKSELLCPADEKKLKEGKISSLDIQISRALWRLSKQYKILENVNFQKAVNIGDEIAIFVDEKDKSSVIGKNGKIAKEISKELKKNVRVITGNNIEEMVKSVLNPSMIRAINVLHTTNGEIYKIICSRREIEKLPIKISHYELILKDLTGKEIRIEGI